MTYEQKFEAINAIGRAEVLMRKPGDWYVHHSVEIKDGSFLLGQYGNGTSPEEAIEDHWNALTVLSPHQYVVLNAYGADRKAVRWNGHRWADVQEDQ